jgi:N-acetylneuraminic acid mutarotase
MDVGKGSSTVIVAAYGYDSSIGSDTNKTRLYNIGTNTWSTGAAAPLPIRSEAGSVAHKGILYVASGRSTSTGTLIGDFDSYNTATNTWAVLPPVPTMRAGDAVAYAAGGVYVIGGRTLGSGPCTGGQLSTVERFDVASGTWSTKAPLPAAVGDAGAMAVGGKIYVFGGCRFNPTTGKLTILKTAYVYTPSSNTWAALPSLPVASSGFYGLGVKGSKIYIIGGYNGTGTPNGNVQIFNVTTSTYSAGPTMTTPRGEMGLASVGGKIYAVGGAVPAFGLSSSANEVLTP